MPSTSRAKIKLPNRGSTTSQSLQEYEQSTQLAVSGFLPQDSSRARAIHSLSVALRQRKQLTGHLGGSFKAATALMPVLHRGVQATKASSPESLASSSATLEPHPCLPACATNDMLSCSSAFNGLLGTPAESTNLCRSGRCYPPSATKFGQTPGNS